MKPQPIYLFEENGKTKILNKIYIVISGGLLEAVYAETDQLGITLLDMDNAKKESISTRYVNT